MVTRKVHARVDEDLLEEVDDIIEQDPKYENRSHAVRTGLRMVVQDQDYRDAE